MYGHCTSDGQQQLVLQLMVESYVMDALHAKVSQLAAITPVACSP